MATKRKSKRRVCLLDELRGFAIVLMVFYHAFYLVGYTFDVEFCRALFRFFYPVQPFFAALFVFLCGISCNFSRSNVKRGLLLAGVAILLSAVMWCAVFWRMLTPDNYIWFGVLHLLAVSILLFALLRPTLKYIPPWLGLVLCAVLFVLCYHVPADMGGYFGLRGLFTLSIPTAATDHPLLYAFGLCPVTLCGDYFPLLPWVFCFFAGTFVGRWKTPKWAYRSRFPWLAVVGKQSLWVYLLHQPALYVICEVILWTAKKIG
ncbi:MAG: DUF1624 domain-containing protein [Clostridia bacterium]|nr:DUF1624 domain-containing protein [Clostridia bacterium]